MTHSLGSECLLAGKSGLDPQTAHKSSVRPRVQSDSRGESAAVIWEAMNVNTGVNPPDSADAQSSARRVEAKEAPDCSV